MGDKVQIPRSFSDSIGVADVSNSIKRHYMTIPLHDTTSGVIFGGNQTTFINFLQRNATFEKILAVAYVSTTVAETTGVILRLFGAGTTTIFDLNLDVNTTVKGIYVSGSTAPINANVSASTPIRLHAPRWNANWRRLSVVLVFRERNDS